MGAEGEKRREQEQVCKVWGALTGEPAVRHWSGKHEAVGVAPRRARLAPRSSTAAAMAEACLCGSQNRLLLPLKHRKKTDSTQRRRHKSITRMRWNEGKRNKKKEGQERKREKEREERNVLKS